MSHQIHQGRCSCGAVRFELSGPLRPVIYCHCLQCRRQSGHFLGATETPNSGLTITAGADQLAWNRSSENARRGFCRICGSALFWKHRGQDRTSVLAGSIDAPTGLTPGYHIFVSQKGDYYEVADGLPIYFRWGNAKKSRRSTSFADVT